MKILHVIPGLTRERGGPTSVIEGLSRVQARRGHCVQVLHTDQGLRRGETAVTLPEGVEGIRVNACGPDRLAYAPGFRRAVKECLKSCDLMHVHSIFTHPVHVALSESLKSDRPVVLRPCGLLHPYSLARSRWIKRAYLARWGAQTLRACSAWHYTSRNEACESWPKQAKKHFVLGNGIEVDQPALGPSRAREIANELLPALVDAPYVLFLGRLSTKKRPALLVEAFLQGAPSDWHLVLVGPDEDRLWPGIERKLLGDARHAARVHRLGLVGGEPKQALLRAAELFALPSEHENFGVAALEALAEGTPVLSSPFVDLADSTTGNEFLQTASLSASAWSASLGRLLDDRRHLEEMGRLGRAWVATHYSWERIGELLDVEYRRLLAGGESALAASHPAGDEEFLRARLS